MTLSLSAFLITAKYFIQFSDLIKTNYNICTIKFDIFKTKSYPLNKLKLLIKISIILILFVNLLNNIKLFPYENTFQNLAYQICKI